MTVKLPGATINAVANKTAPLEVRGFESFLQMASASLSGERKGLIPTYSGHTNIQVNMFFDPFLILL